MNTHPIQSNTGHRSPSDSSRILSVDVLELGAQLSRCRHGRAGWFSIRCVIVAVDRFVAPRFMTTVLAATVVLCISAHML